MELTQPGVNEFLELADAPHSYAGQASKVVKVNAGETAVEFGVGGGGGAVDSVNGQTGVVVLDTGDIAEVTDANYVSDAQLTVLGNTSGTNTGDNATNSQYSGLVSNATHTGDATGQGYDFYMFCKPNDNTIYYRLDNLNLGTTLVDSSVTTTLPAAGTFMGPVVGMSNGTANIVAGTVGIGVNRIYIESDY